MRHATFLVGVFIAVPLACSTKDADNGPAPSADELASAKATIEKLGGKTVRTEDRGPPLCVNFQGSKLTDVDLAQLAGMTNVLHEITLNQLQITDAGLANLKNLTRLRQLDVSMTPITNAGLVHLQGMKYLESLTLYMTAISDGGLERLKPLKNLTTLHLMQTQVTDAGLSHLKGLSKLTWLNVQNTKVTEAGARDLEHALPKITIRRGN